MKTLRNLLIVLGLIAVVMLFTCPKYEDHSKEVRKEFNRYAVSYVNSNVDPDDGGGVIASALVGAFLPSLLNPIVESKLDVKDYGVLSIGSMVFNGERKTVSVGLCRHVFFVFSDEDFAQLLSDGEE